MLSQLVVQLLIIGSSRGYFRLWLQLLAGNSLRHDMTSLAQMQAHSSHLQAAVCL